MPGSTLPNISIVLPSLGGDEGIWDTEINTALGLIDAHDHSPGKGLAINSDAITIDADLSFGSYFISALGKVSFTAIAAPSSGSKSLYVSSADNELYWRTNGGTNVKLTSGSALNISIVGGIAGDYASVGAELAYDDANDRYTFKQQTTFPWAKVACGGLQIFEFNTTESVSVRLLTPAALASSYDMTFPTALPGAAALMQISAAGIISFSNTITATTITAGAFKFTTAQVLLLPASLAVDRVPTHTKSTGATSGAMNRYLIAASALPIVWPICLPVGSRITDYNVYVRKRTDATNTIASRLYKTSVVDGTETALGAGASDATNAPGYIDIAESSLTIDLAVGFEYYLVFTPGAGVAPNADELISAEIVYTMP